MTSRATVAPTAALHVLRSVDGLTQDALRNEVAHSALGEVLDVSATVDLEAFESSEFVDRLRRAKVVARDPPWAAVRSLIGLVSSALGFIALGSVLADLEPMLVPFVIVPTVPSLVVTTRNTGLATACT